MNDQWRLRLHDEPPVQQKIQQQFKQLTYTSVKTKRMQVRKQILFMLMVLIVV